MDWKDGLTVERRAVILIKKMALDADGFMRIGTRESSILAEARPRDRIRWRRLKSRKEIPCRRGEPYVFYSDPTNGGAKAFSFETPERETTMNLQIASDIEDVGEERGAALIMEARKHWFE